MFIPLTNKQRAVSVGTLILLAYTMLTYTITGNKPLGVATDILSGLSVIGIPLLMWPIFRAHKALNMAYMAARFGEGVLMVAGGLFILSPALEPYRNGIYEHIHIYFFILGALFFYALLYRTRAVPRFISMWGGLATLALLLVTVIKLLGVQYAPLDALVIPLVLNEVFLAGWLMVKGFGGACAG
ncbi:MAG TPA: DUF4386 family protein [Rhodobacteraceae bacterium]|nr:DUF4386 family protein [Paracoccaceae bacterium]